MLLRRSFQLAGSSLLARAHAVCNLLVEIRVVCQPAHVSDASSEPMRMSVDTKNTREGPLGGLEISSIISEMSRCEAIVDSAAATASFTPDGAPISPGGATSDKFGAVR